MADDIDGVIAELDAVVARAVAEKSRLGYFAALYRNVTVAVKAAIDAGRFDDAERMSRFDAAFANRYLDAVAAWQAGRPTSKSWKAAFEAAALGDKVIV